MIDVRAAVPDEADAIADINVRSWRQTYRGIIPDAYLAALDQTAIATRVRDATLRQSATILVAGRPDVCGFSWLSRSRDDDATGETAEIVAIYVDPDFERRGIGRALVLASCDAARSQGFTHVSLWVVEQNVRARAFYDALGFVADDTMKITNQWGGTPIREVRYVRPL